MSQAIRCDGCGLVAAIGASQPQFQSALHNSLYSHLPPAGWVDVTSDRLASRHYCPVCWDKATKAMTEPTATPKGG
jgi:hypothetical protein